MYKKDNYAFRDNMILNKLYISNSRMKALNLLFLFFACFVVGILASSSEDSGPSRQNFSADKDVDDMEIESSKPPLSKPPLSKTTRHLSMERERKAKQVSRSTSFQLRKPNMISRTSSQNKIKEDNLTLNTIENKLKQTLSFKKTKKTLKRNKAFNNLDYEDWKKHVEPYENESRRKGKGKYQQKVNSNPFDWKKQQEKLKQSKKETLIGGPSRELRIKLKDPLRSRSPGSSSENSPTSSSGSGSGRSRGSPKGSPRGSPSGSNRGSPLSPNQKGEKRVYLERPFDDLLNQRQSTKLGVCNKPGCNHSNSKCNRRSGGRC